MVNYLMSIANCCWYVEMTILAPESMSIANGLVKDSDHVWTSEEMMHGAHAPVSYYICYSLQIIKCYSYS